VIATMNLNGDYMSDPSRGRSRIGMAPGATSTMKALCAVEATMALPPKYANLDKVNPSS